MSIEELLQQMEDYRTRREQKDHRPAWLRAFVKSAADLFEPLEYTGRVGFDCQPGEQGWIVTMYLGTTEIIGGPRDGQIDHVSFRVDITRLDQLFQNIQRLEWYSVNNESDDRFHDSTRSLLSVVGTVADDHVVQLELLGIPPKYVGPGLKQHENGIPGPSES
ncbi:MAG: hypothetical protein RIK87_13410 [Fuerstiella sp.]